MLNIMHKRTNEKVAGEAEGLFSSTGSQDVRRAEAWLEDRLRRAARGEYICEVITLTPILAELLLRRNPDNRCIRHLRLANYEADMRAGAWVLNGESIKVSDTGLLNDGQHRCQAVVNSGCSIKTEIRFGLSRDSRTTLDQGAVRSPGDYLGMDNVDNPNECAAVAGLLWQYESRRRVSTQSVLRPTKQQVQETYRRHTHIADSVKFVPRKGSSMAGGVSTLAFCHFLMAKKNRDAADYFIGKLVKGDGLGATDPVFVCRERLHGDKRMKVEEKIELIFRAWNAHRVGRRLKKLQVMGGELPTLEG